MELPHHLLFALHSVGCLLPRPTVTINVDGLEFQHCLLFGQWASVPGILLSFGHRTQIVCQTHFRDGGVISPFMAANKNVDNYC